MQKNFTKFSIFVVFYTGDASAETFQGESSPSRLASLSASGPGNDLNAPTQFPAGQPLPITGYAQVGISGLSKVQAWITPSNQE
jgi:hypothetical protein